MSATVNILYYKSKTLANGEHPLMIRVCKDGKKKYQSIGISVKAEFWDFEKNRPKRACPSKDAILQIITKKSQEFNNQVIEFENTSKDYTTSILD